MECLRQGPINFPENKIKKFFGIPRILVVGCGSEGVNVLNRLAHLGFIGAETIALNTDDQHLILSEAEKKILIGSALKNGNGAQDSRIFECWDSKADRFILEMTLRDSDMVFVIAGMGDGTGTFAAPIVAEISKQNGAIVVGMVSTPFCIDRAKVQLVEDELESLRRKADALIAIDNNKLLEFVPHLPPAQAMSIVDQIIAETIMGIVDTLTQPSLINLDFADLRTIMKAGGTLFMSVGETDLRDGPKKIVKNALKNPLVDVDYHGATGCLLHITGGRDLTLKVATEIASAFTQELDPEANIIWGARIRPDFKEKVRLVAIASRTRSTHMIGTTY